MMKDQDILFESEKIHSGPFYKFLGVNGALATLKNATLRFSNPKKFNDPLDCNEELLLDKDYSSKYSFTDLLKLGNDVNPKNQRLDFDDIDTKELITKFEKGWEEVKKHDPSLAPKINILANRYLLYPKLKKEIEKLKICCFSRHYVTKESSLMWSHYTDSQYGICLGFDFEKVKNWSNLNDNFKPLIVNYESDLKQIVVNDTFDYFTQWVLLKSNIWGYEQEVRIIQKSEYSKDYEYYSFPKEALAKIIFGYHTEKKVIKKVRMIIEKHYDIDKIKFERIGIDRKTFSILPIEYNIKELRSEIFK